MENQVRAYILENFMFSNNHNELKNDDSFLEKGIIDSTGVMELVSFLENNFQIKIEDDELVADNLDSVNKILNFVNGKKQVC